MLVLRVEIQVDSLAVSTYRFAGFRPLGAALEHAAMVRLVAAFQLQPEFEVAKIMPTNTHDTEASSQVRR